MNVDENVTISENPTDEGIINSVKNTINDQYYKEETEEEKEKH